jgi:uncharacterized protein (TIGR02466 family)
MNIIRKELWATPVWQFDISADNTAIAKECYQYEQTRAGQEQHNTDWKTAGKFPEISKLLFEIESLSQAWYTDMGVKDRYLKTIEDYWVNVNGVGRFNKPHLHPDSVFTGVYYAFAKNNCGNIVFHNSADKEFTLQTYTDKPNSFNISNPQLEPVEGRVYIFPSWLQHSVETNLSGVDRISISFQFN